ncbi:hypothetical protein SARC_11325 [Sphaeroforma arctica JP610]|uniref:Uncharacterized protein n=1 Tax=Sphaeroforma arctica JP610 TaxID=667725 RepID=A0A0L0FHB5_9EUKA|nr:hypothetical protein SARC_11325 [Sphaeroforma arctica JP610]KNC76164.1 hypothetical protein SARC_11325 [Sphaeroforma arctica JP610]|eukprot:XP_014150066.1 hypothetical protein SARC_11325 [Sphaeroforma arctica JP610]
MEQVRSQGLNTKSRVTWWYPVVCDAKHRTNEYKAATFVFDKAERAWRPLTHDAFALPGNQQLPKYFSPSTDEGALT